MYSNCAQYSRFYIETASKLKYNVGISVRFYLTFMGDYVSKMSHCAYFCRDTSGLT